MKRYKCKICSTLYTSQRDTTIAKCVRCGALNDPLLDNAQVTIKSNDGSDTAKQNFRCLDCKNEFSLVFGIGKVARVCTQCRSTKILPISPLAYIATNRPKDKKKAKFAAYIQRWQENHKRLEAAFDDILYTMNTLEISEYVKEIENIKKKVLDISVNGKNVKLGIK